MQEHEFLKTICSSLMSTQEIPWVALLQPKTLGSILCTRIETAILAVDVSSPEKAKTFSGATNVMDTMSSDSNSILLIDYRQDVLCTPFVKN